MQQSREDNLAKKKRKSKKTLTEKDALLERIKKTIKQIENGKERQLKSLKPYLTGINDSK